jgi:hypothetical protein
LNAELLVAIDKIPRGTSLDNVHIYYILSVLKKNHGNRTRAAKELKRAVRTVRNYVHVFESLGLEVPKYVDWRIK